MINKKSFAIFRRLCRCLQSVTWWESSLQLQTHCSMAISTRSAFSSSLDFNFRKENQLKQKGAEQKNSGYWSQKRSWGWQWHRIHKLVHLQYECSYFCSFWCFTTVCQKGQWYLFRNSLDLFIFQEFRNAFIATCSFCWKELHCF